MTDQPADPTPSVPPPPPTPPAVGYPPPPPPAAAGYPPVAPPPGLPYEQTYAPTYAPAQVPPGYPAAVATPPTSGKAIASLVLGIVAFPAGCFYGIGLVCSILAVVFGYLARGEIRRSQGTVGGDGLAKAGLILGWIGIGLLAVGLVIVIIALIVAASSSTTTS